MPPASSTLQAKAPRGTASETTTDKHTGKIMHVNGQHVVVRLLPAAKLESAFRVHVLPESLNQAQLRLGDLCEISSVDGSTTGYGIAWRADDGMGNRPKIRPVKVTETIRDAFGWEEGSRVTVSKTDAKILHADRINLCDVTPTEYSKPGEINDGCWRIRISSLFVNCEALAAGISFDVFGPKKQRKRFYIESIELRDSVAPEAPSLYSCNDRTELRFPDDSITISTDPARNQLVPMTNGAVSTRTSHDGDNAISERDTTHANGISQQHCLNTDRIGGLVEQCRKLNRQLQRVLDTRTTLKPSSDLCNNPAVLIHGYEGTGKTTLLDALAASGFRRVQRLERETLNGGSVSKNQAIIETIFQDAVAAQPSLILMDDLDTLVPTDDIAYGKTLAREIGKLQRSRVMIVGATRSPHIVKATLLEQECFARLIELPIPDLAAREQILNVLRQKPVFAKDTLSSHIAARTHGFTARDVATLHKRAAIYGCDRYEEECEQLAMGRSPTPPAYAEVMIQIDSEATPASPPTIASQSTPVPAPTDTVIYEDFELALQEVRPTALREIFTEKPKIRWNDIGGSAQVKQDFDQIIGWPLQHKDLLSKLQYQPPKGVLLYGPPGCSKTLTAQAVANTYNFNFIAIKGAELISMYVGESERQIREVFRKAKAASPCVIFFDEIDSIGSERDSAGTKGLNVLTTLLNEMDGFESLKDVFILAATNKPEALDPALMRPGRFDHHVYLGPPNEVARREILAISTRGVALTGDVNFDALVQETNGYSGAEIVRICQTAKEPAIRRLICNPADEVRIEDGDFRLALEKIQRGISAEMLEGYQAFERRSVRE